jgi:hypothetical protein
MSAPDAQVHVAPWRAIWPVIDDLPASDLIAEALADLPIVAVRHGRTLAGRPRWSIRPGHDVPGSGGALLVVICDVMTVRARDLPEVHPGFERHVPATEVDPVVLDRIRSGEPCRTTPIEREAIVPELARRGMGDAEIGRLCMVSDRTIIRLRKRLGIESRYADVTYTRRRAS